MWKYYGTKDNVFWDSESIDKPSREYLDNMNWEVLDINLNLRENKTVQIMLNNKEYRLLRAENDEVGVKLYYTLKSVLKHVENGFVLEYVLDNWCSYTLPLMEKDINVLVDRHQDYDDENYLKFSDDNADNFDLSFNEYTTQKDYKFSGDTFIKNKIKLKYQNPSSMVNACFCFVLNQSFVSDNSAMSLIPILTSDKSVVETHILFQNLGGVSDNICEVPVNEFNIEKEYVLSDKVVNFIENVKKEGGDIRVEVNAENTNNGNTSNIITADLTQYFKSNKIDNTIKIIYKKLHYYRYVYIDLYFPSTKKWIRDIKFSGEFSIHGDTRVLLNVSSRYPNASAGNVTNNFEDIYEVIEKNFLSKLMGVFIVPNIYNFIENFKVLPMYGKDFLVCELPQNGVNLSIPQINNEVDKNIIFNNEKPLFKKIYKYFEYNWLGNNIDLSTYSNFNWAKLLFTNTTSVQIFNNLIPKDGQVLTFPSQQPLKYDEYKNFVNANMNSVNTGYAIEKQRTIMNGVQSGIGSVFGFVGKVLTGNLLGAVSGAANAGFSQANNVIGLKNYEKQIRAKYADTEYQMGNKLLFSTIKDTIWNDDLLNENANYDLIYYKDLTTDSIKQLNNYFLLNGVYNPKYFKLNDLPNTTKHLGFKYAKLNSTNFNQILSKHINLPLDEKLKTFSELEEFRIWDKIPSID